VLALGIVDASAHASAGGGISVASHPVGSVGSNPGGSTGSNAHYQAAGNRNAGCPGVALGSGVSCPNPINKGFGTNKPITCKAGGEDCQRQH
jgi:hypothetical protein